MNLIPIYAMYDVWVALGRPADGFGDWLKARTYAEAWDELVAAVAGTALPPPLAGTAR